MLRRNFFSYSAAPKPPQQQQQLSSFLHRLLGVVRDLIPQQQQSQQQQLALATVDSWREATKLDDIFSLLMVRFHSVRVPVQRHYAQKRALSRKVRQQDKIIEKNLSQEEDAQRQQQQEQQQELDEDQTMVIADAPSEIKRASLESAKKLQRHLERRSRSNATVKTSSSQKRSSSSSSPQLSLRLVTEAVRDMREERFTEFLRTITNKVRSAHGGAAADALAGAMCRAWLNAQSSYGFSFPSSESAASPLLATMLFFAAARDTALFLALQRRIEEGRMRFAAEPWDGLGNNSAMPAWIAALAVTVDVVLTENQRKESTTTTTTTTNKTTTLVDIAAKRLEPLIRDDRSFTVDARSAVQRVLPIVLSTIAATRMHRNSCSWSSFVTGTRGSPSSFVLWSNFATRICGISASSARRSTTISYVIQAPPSFFVAFLLTLCQRRALVLQRQISPSRRAVSASRSDDGSPHQRPGIDNVIQLAIGAVAAHMAHVAAAPAVVSSQAGFRSHGNGSSSGSSAIVSSERPKMRLSLYVRLLSTLAECGCAAWVMESALRDVLPSAQSSTGLFLCHVIASAFPNQMQLMMSAVASETIEEQQQQQQQQLQSSNTSKRIHNNCNSAAFNFFFHSASTTHRFFLLPPSSTALQPVDTVTQPISNRMWQTLVDAARLVSQTRAEELKEKQQQDEQERQQQEDSSIKNKDGDSQNNTIAPRLAEQLALTRIRCACRNLAQHPGKLEALVGRISRGKDDNTSSSVVACNSALDLVLPLLDSQQQEQEQGQGDWCDAVPVLSTWLNNVNAVLPLSTSISKRVLAVNALFFAVADIVSAPPSPFASPSQQRQFAALQLKHAQLASELLSVVAKKLFVQLQEQPQDHVEITSLIVPAFFTTLAATAASLASAGGGTNAAAEEFVANILDEICAVSVPRSERSAQSAMMFRLVALHMPPLLVRVVCRLLGMSSPSPSSSSSPLRKIFSRLSAAGGFRSRFAALARCDPNVAAFFSGNKTKKRHANADDQELSLLEKHCLALSSRSNGNSNDAVVRQFSACVFDTTLQRRNTRRVSSSLSETAQPMHPQASAALEVAVCSDDSLWNTASVAARMSQDRSSKNNHEARASSSSSSIMMSLFGAAGDTNLDPGMQSAARSLSWKVASRTAGEFRRCHDGSEADVDHGSCVEKKSHIAVISTVNELIENAGTK